MVMPHEIENAVNILIQALNEKEDRESNKESQCVISVKRWDILAIQRFLLENFPE